VARSVALTVVGALALTGCDFSVYKLPLPGGADLGDDPYAVTVQFNDVLDLVPQSSVKVNDVTVGRVDDVELTGYTAEVTVLVRGDVRLPDNAVARIRQTSLLGEKFVSLSPPSSGASQERLGDGDEIPLSRTGRNPEVEEVLGAMSLLLNGGGVAQLKTISQELNAALEGRETNVKSLLSRLDVFMGQLDDNKSEIVTAIEKLNALSVSLNEQEGAITAALDEMPAALASIDRQRDDLITMLEALGELSDVGVRVIRDSKQGTIDSLEALAPTLTKLAEAGDALPKALQVFLTYPFVDAVVGKNAAQARNLHMGDYTNLSIKLDLDLTGELDTLPVDCSVIPAFGAEELCGDALDLAQECLADLRDGGNITACTQDLVDLACENVGAVNADLGDLCGDLPDVPDLPEVPDVPVDPGQTLTTLERCIANGPDSRACREVRNLRNLVTECEKPRYAKTRTCRVLNNPERLCDLDRNRGSFLCREALDPDSPLGEALDNLLGGSGSGSGGGDGGGGGGGGVLGGGGLLRPGFGEQQREPQRVSTNGYDDELAPLLVWGMIQR
jgi:phospholipid/cholesterol/gamma-HCH transport system substrate-binding protein